MKTPSLVPKLVTSLQTYDRGQFGKDLTAGIIVGIVALPLAIAFAIASGVTPDRDGNGDCEWKRLSSWSTR
jgi:MFS superfamily sulfate permease-like transporter